MPSRGVALKVRILRNEEGVRMDVDDVAPKVRFQRNNKGLVFMRPLLVL
jgi:hypothetical protein